MPGFAALALRRKRTQLCGSFAPLTGARANTYFTGTGDRNSVAGSANLVGSREECLKMAVFPLRVLRENAFGSRMAIGWAVRKVEVP